MLKQIAETGGGASRKICEVGHPGIVLRGKVVLWAKFCSLKDKRASAASALSRHPPTSHFNPHNFFLKTLTFGASIPNTLVRVLENRSKYSYDSLMLCTWQCFQPRASTAKR